MNTISPQIGPVEAVAEQLRSVISSGRFPVGSRLPSARVLSRRFNVSTRTIGLAIRQLEEERLIHCSPRKGSTVLPGTQRGTRILTFITSHEYDRKHPDSFNRWGGQILASADQSLLEAGYHPTRVFVDRHGRADEPAVRNLIDSRQGEVPAGVLLPGGEAVTVELTRELDRRNIPWVSIKRPTPQAQHNFVGIDMLDAGRVLGGLLARAGRKRLLLMNTQLALKRSSLDLPMGIQAGYLQHGGLFENLNWITIPDALEESASQAFTDHCRDHTAPDAVICGDYGATGVMQACRTAGLAVPKDVAVIGSVGLELAAYTAPPLTTIQQPMHDVGRHAAQLLLSLINEKRSQVVGRVLTPRIVLRGTFTVSDEVIEDVLKGGMPSLVRVDREPQAT